MAKKEITRKMDYTSINTAELEKQRNKLLVLKTSPNGLTEIQQKKLSEIQETLDYINYGIALKEKLKNENNERN